MKPTRDFSVAAVYDRRLLAVGRHRRTEPRQGRQFDMPPFGRFLAGIGRFDKLTAGDPALQQMEQCGRERERVVDRKSTRSRSWLRVGGATGFAFTGGHR
jgi:hypothetical protein